MDPEMERYRAEVAEGYLEPVRYAGRKLRRMQAELREERENVFGAPSLDYSKPHVTGGTYADGVPDAAARLAAMEDAYRSELEHVGRARDEARCRLDAMGGRSADLLRLRYVSALPWVTVAEAMGLSEGRCRNMRIEALSEFYDYLPHTARPPIHRAF